MPRLTGYREWVGWIEGRTVETPKLEPPQLIRETGETYRDRVKIVAAPVGSYFIRIDGTTQIREWNGWRTIREHDASHLAALPDTELQDLFEHEESAMEGLFARVEMLRAEISRRQR